MTVAISFATLVTIVMLSTYNPALAVLVCCVAVCMHFALKSERSTTKAILVNVAAVFFSLAVVESWFWWGHDPSGGTRIIGTVTHGYSKADPDLGYAPVPGRRSTATKLDGEAIVYDVSYTIGADGLRVTPQFPAQGESCVVFFGCSITFGEGVNDDETMPAFFAAAVRGSARVYNFGFSGYGPHQMLATIETARLGKTLDCEPTHFIFLTTFAHVARSAGLSPWDRHGPRYRLDSGSIPHRQGNFDSPYLAFDQWPVPRPIGWALDRSHLYNRFFGRERATTDADVELYLRIIQRSRELTATQYPCSQFHVLLWADERDEERIPYIASRLGAMDLTLHLRSNAVPLVNEHLSEYRLGHGDRHPNARGHKLVGEYLATALLDPRAESPRVGGANGKLSAETGQLSSD